MASMTVSTPNRYGCLIALGLVFATALPAWSGNPMGPGPGHPDRVSGPGGDQQAAKAASSPPASVPIWAPLPPGPEANPGWVWLPTGAQRPPGWSPPAVLELNKAPIWQRL
jgi:hypothetical protein